MANDWYLILNKGVHSAEELVATLMAERRVKYNLFFLQPILNSVRVFRGFPKDYPFRPHCFPHLSMEILLPN